MIYLDNIGESLFTFFCLINARLFSDQAGEKYF